MKTTGYIVAAVTLIAGLTCLFAIPALAYTYPTLTGVSIPGPGCNLTVATSGNYAGVMELDYGSDRYLYGSCYYYNKSGTEGTHQWTWGSIGADYDWTTTAVKTGGTIVLTGTASEYTVTRSIYWNGDKYSISETIQNKSSSDIAVMVNYVPVMTNQVTTNKSYIAGLPFDYNNVSGTDLVYDCAPNPTVFMQQANSSMGFVVEDDVLRQQMYLVTQQDMTTGVYNKSAVADYVFGIPKNGSYTFKFSIYPGGPTHDYWKFINTLRKDWGVNYTCQGPMTYDASYNLTGRSYGITVMSPWYSFMDGAGWSNGVFASQMRSNINQVMSNVNADPNAVTKTPIFMCKLETPSVAVYKLGITNGSTLPGANTPSGGGYSLFLLNTAQNATVEANTSCSQWSDSCLWYNPQKTQQLVETSYVGPESPSFDTNATHWFDFCCYPGAKPAAWQAKGTNWQSYALTDLNYQTQYMKNQIDFTLNYCLTNVPANCSKGVYMDSFDIETDIYNNWSSTSYSGIEWNPRMDMGQWDGYTISQNQMIINGYITDATLVGIPARAYLINYVLNTCHVPIICNGHCVDAECRTLPYMNFAETYWDAVPDITHLKLLCTGGEPWGSQTMASGHLSSPLAVGIWYPDTIYTGSSGDSTYVNSHVALIQNKYMIMCLRNAQLETPYINQCPAGGGWGIMNLMYPFTPVELHEGYLIGKEKILTAVSGTFYWNKTDHPNPPTVCKTFDVNGLPNTPKAFSVTSVGAQWKVKLKLQSDWNGTAAIW
jgi:hypothetical protein